MEHAKYTSLITNMPTIIFSKHKRSLHLKEGTELIRLPHIDSTIPINFGCCQGQCGTCAIKIVEGKENLSPKTKQEKETLSRLELEDEYRLACQCALKGKGSIWIE